MNIGATLVIFVIIYYVYNRQSIINKTKISLEEFNSLNPDSYELIYIGKPKHFKRLKPNMYKTFESKEIKKLKKQSKQDLPFNLDKQIIVSALNADNIVLFNELASKKQFSYRFLAEVDILKN